MHINQADYQHYLKTGTWPTAAKQEGQPKRNKYNAKKTTVDGITFDSQREAKRYQELTLLHQAGEVLWFARQCEFVLPGGIKYRADFIVVTRDGVTVEDVKGFKTPEYQIKKKLMRSEYGIEIVEI